jgi:hypothetical protein
MVRDGSTREAQRFIQLTHTRWEELKDAKEGNGTVIAAVHHTISTSNAQHVGCLR